jgi:thiol reductant ABC exporter CydD subunit
MSTDRPARPHLVPPALAARLPSLRVATGWALVLGALGALATVVGAVALATVVQRSLLHHAPLGAVTPELVVVGIALAARGVLATIGERAAFASGDTVVATLRRDLIRHAMALGPSWLAGERAGELSLTATRGLRSLHTYFARYLPQAAAAATIPILLLAWVASQDWLSLVVVVLLVLAVPLTMIYFGRQAATRAQRQWRALGSLAGRFLQLIEGLPTLRAFGREEQGRREVEGATEGVRQATMRTLRVAFLSALSMDLIAGFGVGFVAMVLGLRLLWGELSLQTAMAVLLVAPEIFVPLRRAGAEFHASTEGQSAAERVLEVLDTPLPADHGAAPSAPTAATPAAGPLHIETLRVEYPDRSTPALHGFSLVVPPGSRVALVGPSGAGKSTVLAALLGFVSPTAGAMRIGSLLAEDTAAAMWRSHFAWLPQRPYLFSATLGENLRLGAPGASDEEVTRVLDAVGLGAALRQLRQGLETRLGQGGLTMSAGERQRLALARALLSPAPILLLDEPTASLDPATVALMAPAIEPWLAGRTVLVAAHDRVLLDHFDAVHTMASADLGVVAAP